MAAQLLHLRLLTYSRLPFAFRASFSSHLKTLAPSSGPLFFVRRFSYRPARSRDHGRTGFRTERSSAGAGAGTREKSLIEDEAELSDWVSDLKTDSFRLGLGSDDEDSRAGSKSSTKRAPRSSGGFPERSSRGSFAKKRFDSDDEEEEDGERAVYGKRANARGSSGSFSKGRYGGDLGLMKRGGRNAESTYRQGKLKKSLVLDSSSEEEDDEEEEDSKGAMFGKRANVRGSSGSFLKGRYGSDLGLMKRGGRNAESTYRHGQTKKSLVLDSSEEEEDDDDDDFDDEDEDDEDDGDGGVMSGVEDDYFGVKMDSKKAGLDDSLKIVDSGKTVSRSSGGDKYSYLSEMR